MLHFLASGATCWRFVGLHRPEQSGAEPGAQSYRACAAQEQVQTASSGHSVGDTSGRSQHHPHAPCVTRQDIRRHPTT